MKIKRLIIISVSLVSSLILTSCNFNSNSSKSEQSSLYGVKWITPTGAPTLAFYDQGNNSNWVSNSNPSVVSTFLKTETYDAVVFDGINGLNIIDKANEDESPYKLADWISGGTFYLISTKHTKEDIFSNTYTVQSFVQNGNASRAFRILSEKWGWDINANNNVTYVDGVNRVRETIENNPNAYDYYVVAEPILTSLKNSFEAKNMSLNVIYDFQEEWKKEGLGDFIPAAAIFVNINKYTQNKAAIDAFLTKLRQNKENAIKNPSEVIKELDNYNGIDAYGNKKLLKRFGFENSNIVKTLQSDNKNGFNIISSNNLNSKKLANDFAIAIGQNEFNDNLFLE